MGLKLFRHTGYSSILAPGETRLAPHPGWAIAVTSLWIGIVCNAALWREVSMLPELGPGVARVWISTLMLAAASIAVLSLLGWRRTLKPAATLLLLAAACAAWASWKQGSSVAAGPFAGLAAAMQTAPKAMLGWSLPVFIAILFLPPAIWLWRTPLRRLGGPQQLMANLAGMATGVLLMLTAALI